MLRLESCLLGSHRVICNVRGYCTDGFIKLSYANFKSKDASHASTAENKQPPLILMHGLLGNKRNFQSIAKAINRKTGRQVLTVDLRNHGESPHTTEMNYFAMSRDIKHLLENLNIEEADVLGHSMGGRVAMTLALTEADMVNKLIVEDVSPLRRAFRQSTIPAFLKAIKDAKFDHTLPSAKQRKSVDSQLMRTVPEKAVRDFILTNLIRESDRFRWKMNIDVLIDQYVNVSDFPQFHSTFNGKTIFIGGGNSDYLRAADLTQIQGLFPKAQLQFVPGVGHWVHSENPKAFLDIVYEFLDEGTVS